MKAKLREFLSHIEHLPERTLSENRNDPGWLILSVVVAGILFFNATPNQTKLVSRRLLNEFNSDRRFRQRKGDFHVEKTTKE